MEATTEQPKLWSSTQAYSLCVVFLLLGIIVGYLLHAPNQVAATMALQPQAGMAGRMPSPDQLKRMADKAAEPTLAALQNDPNNPELLAKAGSVYFRAQQYSTATEYYERAVKIKPTAEGFVSLSNAYHFSGSDDRAITMLTLALQIDPTSANALFNFGMLNWQAKNDPKAAIDAWQRLLKAHPTHPRRAQVEAMIAKAKQHMKIGSAPPVSKPGM